ncbi:MAG: hypothetical protein ABJN14_12900 [Paracoccaceae bacterium]
MNMKKIEDAGCAFENWQNGYLTGWKRIGVGARPLSALQTYLNEDHDISSVQFDFNKAYGDSPADMAILAENEKVSAIQCDAWFQDSSILSRMNNLRSFRDSVFDRKGLDWDALENLEDLGLYDCHGRSHPKYEKLQNLKSLSTSYLPARYKTFDQFCGAGIEHLSIRRSPIACFSGLNIMPNLDELHFEGCRKLTSLGLTGVLPSVRHVRLINCPNLDRFEFICEMPHLQSLEVEGLGEVKSFEPFLSHPTLKSVSGVIRKGARMPQSVVQTMPNLEFISPALVDELS